MYRVINHQDAFTTISIHMLQVCCNRLRYMSAAEYERKKGRDKLPVWSLDQTVWRMKEDLPNDTEQNGCQ